MDATAGKLVFTTGDGSLFLYDTRNPQVFQLRTNREFDRGEARFTTISPLFGRFVAWEDRVTHGVYLLDLENGNVQTLPYPDLLPGLDADSTVLARVPFFYGADPFHLYVSVIRNDATFRIYEYAIYAETILNLTLLNVFSAPLQFRLTPGVLQRIPQPL